MAKKGTKPVAKSELHVRLYDKNGEHVPPYETFDQLVHDGFLGEGDSEDFERYAYANLRRGESVELPFGLLIVPAGRSGKILKWPAARP